jgi:hypothetical protein
MPKRRVADGTAEVEPAAGGIAEPENDEPSPAHISMQDDPEAGIPNLAGTAGEGSVALAGRSRENKLVHLAGDPSLVGRTVRVRIDYAGPFALRGQVVAGPGPVTRSVSAPASVPAAR